MCTYGPVIYAFSFRPVSISVGWALDTQDSVKNYLVPSMDKATDEEIAALCKQYNMTIQQLPHIKMTDAGLAGISVGAGDVVKIKRKSWLTGESTLYYRLVVD